MMKSTGYPVLRMVDGQMEWGLFYSIRNSFTSMTGKEIEMDRVFMPAELALQVAKPKTKARVFQEFQCDAFGDVDFIQLQENDIVEVLDLAPEVDSGEPGWCKVKKDNMVGLYPLVLLEFFENF